MTWQKGQSGNPGGRPKEDAALRKAIRDAGPGALERLIKIAANPKHPDQYKANVFLIEQGFGKAPQTIEGNMDQRIEIIVRTFDAKKDAKLIEGEAKVIEGRKDDNQS